jgi:acyl-coenzyme A synthetase/AMP-(fatty) acid ligase
MSSHILLPAATRTATRVKDYDFTKEIIAVSILPTTIGGKAPRRELRDER